MMVFQVVKLIIYIISISISMYGLSCFNFEGIVLKHKLRQFYAFYFIASIALGYLFASFIFDFMTIHF